MIWNVTNETLHQDTIDFMNNAILKMPTILLQNFADEIVTNLHKCETEELLEQLMWTHNRCLAELKARGV
jgi:hypothetical protein